MPLSGPAVSGEQSRQRVAGSLTLRRIEVQTEGFSSLPRAGARSRRRAYQPAEEALREALNIASELSDPKLEARLLVPGRQ